MNCEAGFIQIHITRLQGNLQLLLKCNLVKFLTFLLIRKLSFKIVNVLVVKFFQEKKAVKVNFGFLDKLTSSYISLPSEIEDSDGSHPAHVRLPSILKQGRTERNYVHHSVIHWNVASSLNDFFREIQRHLYLRLMKTVQNVLATEYTLYRELSAGQQLQMPS